MCPAFHRRIEYFLTNLYRLYNASLNLGVASGAIIDGFIVKFHPWRYIYYVAIALIGCVTLIVYATFPETAYIRNIASDGRVTTLTSSGQRMCRSTKGEEAGTSTIHEVVPAEPTSRGTGFVQGLKLYHGKYTHESLWHMTIRPVGLLILPPVLWATLVMSVTIGFIVAVTSNVAPAFNTAYGFESWQSGLCFFSAIVGCFFGIFLGGNFSDWVADYFTRRNGGIREPEMRLPAIMIGAITGPLALALYGCGIKWQMHWIVPTIGIGLSKSLQSPVSRNINAENTMTNIVQSTSPSLKRQMSLSCTPLTAIDPSQAKLLSLSSPSNLRLGSCSVFTRTRGWTPMDTMWPMARWQRFAAAFSSVGFPFSSGERRSVRRLLAGGS